MLKYINKFAGVVSGVFAVSAVSLAQTGNELAINAAVADATTNVTATTTGVIAIAALCFGLGLIIRWLSK